MNKNDKKPLAMDFDTTAKWACNRISFAQQAASHHSVTHKPLDYKNNGSYTTVIKLLSKDLLKRRKPA